MIKWSNWFFFTIVLLYGYSGCKDTKSVEEAIDSISYDGIWAENESDNASFIIKGDTIIDFEHGDRMRFKVIGDSILINYGDFTGRHFILKHTQDSLILQNEDNSITKLYKR